MRQVRCRSHFLPHGNVVKGKGTVGAGEGGRVGAGAGSVAASVKGARASVGGGCGPMSKVGAVVATAASATAPVAGSTTHESPPLTEEGIFESRPLGDKNGRGVALEDQTGRFAIGGRHTNNAKWLTQRRPHRSRAWNRGSRSLGPSARRRGLWRGM